jgi:hypothetical protein
LSKTWFFDQFSCRILSLFCQINSTFLSFA